MPDRTPIVQPDHAASSNKQSGPPLDTITREIQVTDGPRSYPSAMDGFQRAHNFDQLPGQPKRLAKP